MFDWVQEQRRRNVQSREAWHLFANHRERVTQLLLQAAPAPKAGRLCVLGAGNCNDLVLSELNAAFREVHLVDIDKTAMIEALTRQGFLGHSGFHLHGEVDLAGLPANADIMLESLVSATVNSSLPELPGPFDVVASVCLLTQLLDAVQHGSALNQSRMFEVITTIRLRHLQLLLELTAPNGTALLITDIVSSESFAPLPTISEAELPATLVRLINQRNFFTGVNPVVLENLLRTDPTLASRVASVRQLRPWLWNLGPRVYAVCTLQMLVR